MAQKLFAVTAAGKYLYRNYPYYRHTISPAAGHVIPPPGGTRNGSDGNGKNNARYRPALGAAGLRDPKGGSRLSPGGGQYAGGGAMRKPGGDDLAAVHRSAGAAENMSLEVIDLLLKLWAGAELAEIKSVWYSPASSGFGMWEAPVDLEGERIMRGTRDDTVIDRIGRCIHAIGEPHTGVIRRLYVGRADVRRWERAAALRAFAAAWQAE